MDNFKKLAKLDTNIIGIDPSLTNMGLAILRVGVLKKYVADKVDVKEMFDTENIQNGQHTPICFTTFNSSRLKGDAYYKAHIQVADVDSWVDWETFEFTTTYEVQRHEYMKRINRRNYMNPVSKTIVIMEKPHHFYPQANIDKFAYTLGLLEGALSNPYNSFEFKTRVIVPKSILKEKARKYLKDTYPSIAFVFDNMNIHEIDAFMCIQDFIEKEK